LTETPLIETQAWRITDKRHVNYAIAVIRQSSTVTAAFGEIPELRAVKTLVVGSFFAFWM
jgi:hypothetical protein